MHLALDRSSVAAAVAMCAVIVLLLAGTELLDWWWAVAVALVSLGVALFRLGRRVPSRYVLAQRIDRQLKLADALSTATYFARPEAKGDEAVRERQRRDAEHVARSVDLHTALPLRRPRWLYPAFGLAAVAVGLFALRYGVTGTLSLQPSLVKIAFESIFAPNPVMAKSHGPKANLKGDPQDPTTGDSTTTSNDQPPDSVLDTVDTPDVNNSDASDQSKDKATTQQNQENGDQQADGEKGDKSDQNATDSAGQDNQDKGDSKDSNGQPKQDGKQGNSNQESSSLMDKLRDAVANMMNKMRMPQNGQQSAQNKQQGQQDSKQGQNQKSDSSQSQSANADQQSEGEQQADNGSKNQNGDQRGAQKGADKNASQDSKSGIGSEDGDKSTKLAEQLAAMGKITEIFGKRSANLQGEVMVEVGSSKQQLKTPWAQKQAQHSEAGSEIHRDEVPLMYQQFVEQYFEEIRKTPDSSKSATPKNSSKTVKSG